MGEIIGLTGSSGKGKTFACLELAGRLIDQGVVVKGFCSPPVFEDSIKTAIDVLSLPSFERRRLGVLAAIEGYTLVRKWSMDPATFEWINRMSGRFSSTDVLMFDEFGPLEVEQGQGWHKALDVLKTGKYYLAVITFRPDYQDFFKREHPGIHLINLDGHDTPDVFYTEVVDRLRQAQVLKAQSNG